MAAAVCSSYKRVNGQRPLYVYKRPFVYVHTIYGYTLPPHRSTSASVVGQRHMYLTSLIFNIVFEFVRIINEQYIFNLNYIYASQIIFEILTE